MRKLKYYIKIQKAPAGLKNQWRIGTCLGYANQVHQYYSTTVISALETALLTLNKPATTGRITDRVEVKLDLTFWPIATDRWGLNWKNQVWEEGGVYDVSPRYRGQPFRDIPQIGAAPAVHLERGESGPDWEPASPRTLRGPRPETDRNFLLAPHRTSPALRWSV
jgi:hypothetical protein